VPLTDERSQGLHTAQVAVDFTLPAVTEANLRACVEHGTALVVGTTGLEERHERAMQMAAHEIPIVYARNMSVGVNVFMELVGRAAKALGDGYDVEIAETHHRHKIDAPSGTALALGERVALARGRTLDELAVYSRHGQTGPRVPGTIGFAVTRGGNVVGEHAVRFIGTEEEVEFSHRAGDRKTFARGALRAARWAAGRAPGLYSMADVLGLVRD
jgi:4-hydroxy-tetrahydrodipicolinate reductase